MFITHADNMGEFKNENNKFYSYRKTTDEWALSHNFTHEIDVLDGVRFGVVKKSVALICVNEDENGPIVEKWKLKLNLVYGEN
jgi:hypothetical protein